MKIIESADLVCIIKSIPNPRLRNARFKTITQQTFTCSKSTIETLEKGVKCVQS